LLLAVVLLTPPPARAAEPDWAVALSHAREALARGDSAAARAGYVRADSILGGHPNLLVRLAAFAAHHGDRDEALGWLRQFAAMGLDRAIERDTSFASLAGDTAFTGLVGRIHAAAAPVARAKPAIELGDAALLTEDVVWDAPRQRFLVSSIHLRKVVAVDARGTLTEFAHAEGDSVWGFYALACDTTRGVLWATTAASPTSEGYLAADSGRTAVIAYDLARGRPLRRVELPRDGARHVLGDVTLAPDGTLYLTESLGGGVYRLAPGGARLDTIAPSGTFGSPQTPVLAPDRRRLLVPDYPRGIAVIELSTREVRWLPKPRSLASLGIDGLYRVEHRLIAIQNGPVPHRVLELTLDSGLTRIESWRVLDQASERLGEPNHGVIVGNDFWLIGDSGWDRVSEHDELVTPAGTKLPVLLRLPLVR